MDSTIAERADLKLTSQWLYHWRRSSAQIEDLVPWQTWYLGAFIHAQV